MNRVLLLAAASLCAAAPADAVVRHEKALPILKRLVSFGNRHAGAPRRGEAIVRLERMMKERGLKTERTSFTRPDPKTRREWKMVNLIGRYRPERPCRFLLGTHFDTRHVAEEDPDPEKRLLPIPGANDGTSGVAVLLALAPRLKKIVPESLGVDLAFFDGEEMGYPDAGGYCAGSAHYASQAHLLKTKPKFGIILDMVCAPSGIYKIEPNSMEAAGPVVEALWTVGGRLGGGAFSDQRHPPIGDDHVPLSNAGIPSALLIGFDYGPWHTSEDTAAQCSAARLDLIGEVLEEFIASKAAALAVCAPPR